MTRSIPWLVFALLFGAGQLWAESALEPPETERYLRWGPLRVRPGLEVRELGYEDNILVTNNSIPPVSDFRLTLAPKVDGLVLFGSRMFLTFKEQIRLAGYLENSQLNYVDQIGSARLTLPRDRIGLFVEGVLNRINERPVDAEALRPLSTENGLAAGLIVQPGWRTEVELGRSLTFRGYEDELNPSISNRLDRDIERDFIEVRYRARGRTRLTLDADRRTIEFRNPASAIRDSDAWSVLPGVQFGEGGRLSGTARLGWAVIEPADFSRADLDGVVGDAELAYRPNRRTTIRAGGWRRPGFTASGQDVYYLDTRAKLSFSLFFTRALGFEIGGSEGSLDFESSNREDVIQTYDVALLLRVSESQIGRKMVYRIQYRQNRRSSTEPSQNYSNASFGMNAVVGF